MTENPQDFENFLAYAKCQEYDPMPSRRTVLQPLSSREGFSKAFAAIDEELLPLVLITMTDKYKWFESGNVMQQSKDSYGRVMYTQGSNYAGSPIEKGSRSHKFLEWALSVRDAE